ncbi:MAG TPA: TetR/AcrR family transcriptional regulator [Stellaceae bacterium]|nr:TetR/AcrR family transcriptional regulator [Stellaceae bacterium]
MRLEEASRGGKAESILVAAQHHFLEHGFGAVSMDAIAREAGVSKATVYAHFASKEELFGAIVARVSERHFHGFSPPELDPRDIAASLAVLARRFLDLLLSPEAIALNRIIIAEVARFPGLGEVFWQAGPERSRLQIEAFLRRAVEAGSLSIADTRQAAEQFAALARGEIHLRQLLRLDAAAGEAALAQAARLAAETFANAFRSPGRA